MQKELSSQIPTGQYGTLIDIAGAGWAALVTFSFVAHILGVAEPAQAVEIYLYPLVVAISVIIIVLALIRPRRGCR